MRILNSRMQNKENIKKIKLNSENLWNELDKLTLKKGVYLLKICNERVNEKIENCINIEGKKIGRLLEIDESGTLYIGKCNNFMTRVINLKKSILDNYNNNSHICGRRYKKIPNYNKFLPFDNMIVEIFPHKNPDELEKDKLKKYFNKFGEVPPLNAVI